MVNADPSTLFRKTCAYIGNAVLTSTDTILVSQPDRKQLIELANVLPSMIEAEEAAGLGLKSPLKRPRTEMTRAEVNAEDLDIEDEKSDSASEATAADLQRKVENFVATEKELMKGLEDKEKALLKLQGEIDAPRAQEIIKQFPPKWTVLPEKLGLSSGIYVATDGRLIRNDAKLQNWRFQNGKLKFSKMALKRNFSVPADAFATMIGEKYGGMLTQ